MRVSELASVTLDAIKTGKISISCKEKHRQIYLVHKLKWKLLDYCKKKNIKSGVVFITRNGNPVNRSNIWTEMKKVAEKAFLHNLLWKKSIISLTFPSQPLTINLSFLSNQSYKTC